MLTVIHNHYSDHAAITNTDYVKAVFQEKRTPAVTLYWCLWKCNSWLSSILELFVPSYCLTTIGSCSFPVVATIVWNTLPVHVQSSPSIQQPFANGWRHSCFNSHFRTSASDITNYVIVDFEMAIAVLATLKISDWLIDWSVILNAVNTLQKMNKLL